MPSVHILGTRGYPSYYGGFETAVRHLVPFLVKNGWETIVYGRPGMIRHRSDIQCIEGVSKLTRGVDNFRFSTISYGFTSTIAAARDKPDVVLIMNVANCIWLPLLRIRKIPTVVNVDGIEWKREKWGFLAKVIFLLGAKLTAKLADAVITDSKGIQSYWEDKFKVKSRFIPYGSTVERDLPSPPELESGKYILYVARFVPENSISEILGAVPGLTEFATVVLVGSDDGTGRYNLQIRELCNNNPKVLWFGRINDDNYLNSLWNHSGIYIHGHTVGGTNPALVQAMGCGAVVLAKDNLFNRETLSSNDFYFESSSQIISMAKEIFQNPETREQISSENRNRADLLYNWPQVCSDYAEILKDTIEAKKTDK